MKIKKGDRLLLEKFMWKKHPKEVIAVDDAMDHILWGPGVWVDIDGKGANGFLLPEDILKIL